MPPHVGITIYRKLRSRSGRRPHINHKAMFEALPNDEERLHLINFLYHHGEQNPIYFVDRFSEYFREEELRFASKETGFKLRPRE